MKTLESVIKGLEWVLEAKSDRVTGGGFMIKRFGEVDVVVYSNICGGDFGRKRFHAYLRTHTRTFDLNGALDLVRDMADALACLERVEQLIEDFAWTVEAA